MKIRMTLRKNHRVRIGTEFKVNGEEVDCDNQAAERLIKRGYAEKAKEEKNNGKRHSED